MEDTMTLEGMTQKKWDQLSRAEKDEIIDLSDLTTQLIKHEGYLVEVIDKDDQIRRFIVGISGGWKPVHVELRSKRSLGGLPADKWYKSVRIIEKVY